MMLEYEDGQVISKLVDLANRSSNSELRYNCAGTLGQIAVIGMYLSHDYLKMNP
jgi:hypothetical protein